MNAFISPSVQIEHIVFLYKFMAIDTRRRIRTKARGFSSSNNMKKGAGNMKEPPLKLCGLTRPTCGTRANGDAAK